MIFTSPNRRILSNYSYFLLNHRKVYSKLPAFNYGLPGNAKRKSKKKPKTSENLNSIVLGEVIFGIHPILLSLKAQRRKQFYQLFMDRNLKIKDSLASICDLCEKLQIDVTSVPRENLDILSGNRPHQGVCLDTEPLKLPLWVENKDFPKSSCNSSKSSDWNRPPVWLILYNIQDPMNLGAILRSSYFFGVDKILLTAKNSCRPNPVVSKASAGAMELLDLVSVPYSMSLASVCQWWKSNGGQVFGTGLSEKDPANYQPLHKCKVTTPTLIILGNEGSGISNDIVQECDQMLIVPQSSTTLGLDSLNVSVAAGIILHWLKYSSEVD